MKKIYLIIGITCSIFVLCSGCIDESMTLPTTTYYKKGVLINAVYHRSITDFVNTIVCFFDNDSFVEVSWMNDNSSLDYFYEWCVFHNSNTIELRYHNKEGSNRFILDYFNVVEG